jgi:KDO2-lipid IV(A) lauroyltransferase
VKKQTRHKLEAAAVALLATVVSLLPRRATLRLGRGLGGLWGRLDGRHRAIAREGLRQSFPDWSAARLERTARAVYVHFGSILIDILWLSRHSGEALHAIVEWEGIEHFEAARATGRGILFVTGHFGNWEVLAVDHAHERRAVAVIARPLDNPALDERLCAFRRRAGSTVIPKRHALAHVLRTLRAGQDVAILIDQNVQEQDGIFVEFFGRPAATTTAAAAVALKTNCIVMPVRSRLLPDGRYRLTYEPPVAWQASADHRADIARLTQLLTRRIETWVRETPEQWLWIHRRWKTQPTTRR